MQSMEGLVCREVGLRSNSHRSLPEEVGIEWEFTSGSCCFTIMPCMIFAAPVWTCGNMGTAPITSFVEQLLPLNWPITMTYTLPSFSSIRYLSNAMLSSINLV